MEKKCMSVALAVLLCGCICGACVLNCHANGQRKTAKAEKTASVLAAEKEASEDSLLSEHFESKEESKPDTVREESSYVPIEIPPRVAALLDSTDWMADTLCCAKGKPYFFANDGYARTIIIFDKYKALVEDPTLVARPLSKTKFQVRTVAKTVTVDFAKPKTIYRLGLLSQQLPSFTRYRRDIYDKANSSIMFGFCVDFPSDTLPGSSQIKSWLLDVIDTTTDPNVEVFDTKLPQTRKTQFQGDVNKHSAAARHFANRYFRSKHAEYEDNDFMPALFCDIDMRAVVSTERFVTYQKYAHNYEGGIHGFYVEMLISYDPVHEQEIDWDYLFLPQSRSKVWGLIVSTAKNDPHFVESKGKLSTKEARRYFLEKDENGNLTARYISVDLGLGPDGVVFSFQPYSICCFAAGTFHFTVPYEKLEPYLTDQAKWCLQM
ncbi:MAG: DUF3298 domain-containing protein [Bacteroidaceae bacterium]|nr:DUF3298 domain-containing protein [Bacteroidaceae bacterium]